MESNQQPTAAVKADPMRLLTGKQQRFVLAYAESGNGAQAAREAGYSEASARIEASKQLRKPAVRAALSAFMEEQAMSAGEAIGRLTIWARGSLEPFVRYADEVQYNPLTNAPFVDTDGNPVTKLVATLDLTTPEARANIHLLKKIKQGQYGLEVELTDPFGAVDKLLHVHGRYKTKIDISMLSDEELDALLEKALAKIA